MNKSVILWSIVLTLFIVAGINIVYNVTTAYDLYIYYNYANRSFHNEIPFKDYNIEYPPGAFIIMLIPYLFARTLPLYKVAFTLWVSLFALIGAIILYKKKNTLPFLLYLLFIFSSQPFVVFQRLDLIVGVITLLSIILMKRKQYDFSLFFLALAATIKIYPIILFPFYLLVIPDWKKKIKQCLIIMGTIFCVFLPFILQARDSVFYFWEYNKNRGIQIESIWSSLVFALHYFIGEPFKIYYSYGSVNIESPLTNLFTALALYGTLFSIVILFLLFLFLVSEKNQSIPSISFLAISLFILLNKVLSPQYMLWIIPLYPLGTAVFKKNTQIIMNIVFFSIIILSDLIYPYYYNDIANPKPFAVTLLILRNILLIILIVYYIIEFFKLCRRKNLHTPSFKEAILQQE